VNRVQLNRARRSGAWAAVIVAGAGMAVTGCGASAAGPAQGEPHPVAAHGGPTMSPSPRATATALPKASCGNAVTHGLNASTEMLSAGKTALTCFSAAAKACAKASLEVTEMGVDTGTLHVFAITAAGKPCQVTELSQFYSANFGGSTGPVSSAGCRVMVTSQAGVTLTCAGEKLLIPVRVTSLS
jgi:hypothetical protein